MSSERDFFSALLNENGMRDGNDDIENTTLRYAMWTPVVTSLALLIIGLIKAILGCCCKKLDKWKFDYVQSFKTYEESGRLFKFCINMIMFILLPVAFCSNCCTSKNLRKNSKVHEKKFNYFSDSDDCIYRESTSLLNCSSSLKCTPSNIERNYFSSETLFESRNLKTQFADKDEEECLLKDTEFVIKAMHESHDSLSKSHPSQQVENQSDEKSEAKEYVDNLLAARVVYRKLLEPIGGVKVNTGQAYSIRGYFLPGRVNGYQFVTYNPLKQVYEISSDSMLVPISPQIYLDAKAFRQFYKDKNDLFNAGDLSLQPALSSPCINIVVQDRSMYSK